jgi:hypothetical protein
VSLTDCSVCLARGRSYTVPTTTLIDNCDRWHISDIADSHDGPMNSMAVLRRDLVSASDILNEDLAQGLIFAG